MVDINKLKCYKTLPIWTAETLPEAFKQRHNTKQGTWAKLEILSGSLMFELMNDAGDVISSHQYSKEHQPDFIEPKQYHRIATYSHDLKCQLSFYQE